MYDMFSCIFGLRMTRIQVDIFLRYVYFVYPYLCGQIRFLSFIYLSILLQNTTQKLWIINCKKKKKIIQQEQKAMPCDKIDMETKNHGPTTGSI